ncbi:MAG: DUF2490 domain-containing protein [Verrucomicrobiota bacterium]
MTTPRPSTSPLRPTRGLLRPTIVTTLLVLLVLVQARAGDPVETWLGFGGKTAINQRLTAVYLVESKFRDDLDFRYQDYVDLGVSYQLGEHWSVAPVYRHIRTRAAPAGAWTHVYNPLPTLNWQDTVGGWKLGWRNQLDIQLWDGSADKTTWRSRVMAMPAMSDETRWQPYVNNEFFFDDRTRRWSQNRAFLGTYYTLDGHWKLEAYIGYKSDWRAGHWQQTRMTGARACLSF